MSFFLGSQQRVDEDEIVAMDDPDTITNDENDAIDSGEPDSVHVNGEPHHDGGDDEEDKVNSRIFI